MISLKSVLAKPFAKRIYKKVQKWANNPIETQHKVFHELVAEAAQTAFGKNHDFISINNHERYFMERQALIFCKNIWYNVGCKIYSHNKRKHA